MKWVNIFLNKKIDKEIKDEQVKCEECKHWIDKIDAQKVVDTIFPKFYCPMHRKPYDEIGLKHREDCEYVIPDGKSCKCKTKKAYYKTNQTIEVDEKGKPIK